MNRTGKFRGWLGIVPLLAVLLPAAAALGAATPTDTTTDANYIAKQPTGYVVPPVLTRYDLRSGQEFSFQGSFEKEKWYGDVYAYPVDEQGVVNYAGEYWHGAGYQLYLQNTTSTGAWDPAGRRIVTSNGSSGVPFLWGSLTSAQQTAIGTSAIVDYVRGDQSNEATLRARDSVLGDIIHSRPYMYDGLLYIGANDGMVHVLNVNNATALDVAGLNVPSGGEVWAYIPSMLVPKLKNLAVKPYVHTYYCDGPLAFGFANFGSGNRKIIVGTLGAGGKGIFALDVTNPVPTSESDAAAKVLWEKSNANYPNLGYTYSLPAIVRVNVSGTPTPAVIIGNGYVNSGNGHATLLVLRLQDGALIQEIDTGVAGNGGPNGLSTPTVVDYDADDKVDFAYAGDLDGKMWRFDLRNATPSSWTATALNYQDGAAVTAAPAAGKAITAAPVIGPHPSGGFMVNFVTGRMLTAADVSDTAVQYAYGIWDKWGTVSGVYTAVPTTNTTMLQQTMTETVYTPAVGTPIRVRTATATTPDWASHKGWKTPLCNWSGSACAPLDDGDPLTLGEFTGERMVGDGAFISSGRFYFMSTNPTHNRLDPPTIGFAPDGDNWLMELNYLSGGGAYLPFLDLSGDLLLDNRDRVVNGTYPLGIPGAAGVPVGKYAGRGVNSQPVLVKLVILNTALYNNHPDMVVPTNPDDRGVSGGHFDFDIHYPPQTCSSTYVTDQTYTCAGKPASCRTYTTPPYSVPTGYQESCSAGSSSGTTTNTCTGNYGSPLTCATVLGYTVPPGVTETCTANFTSGGTYTCAGDHSAGTCMGHVPAPSPGNYTVPAGSGELCTKITGTTVVATNICVKNKSTCNGQTLLTGSTPYTYPLVDAVETCGNQSVSGTTRTVCKKYAVTTSCTIRNWTNTNCSYGNFTTTCLVKRPETTCTASGTWASETDFHIHEYDDKFDVTGVNMLNASDIKMNLNNVIKNNTTKFKVLLANQVLSPATKIHIGGTTTQLTTAYDNNAVIASLGNATTLTYTMATINSLMVSMPLNAFEAKAWPGGDGVIRSGLVPTQTGCVKGSNTPGILGTRRNGSLTFQIIKYDTPASAIELNVAGNAAYGHRVKAANIDAYLLAEYTIFWHHDNGMCTQVAGWVPAAPQDTAPSSTAAVTRAPGSADPSDGTFGLDPSGIVSITTVFSNGGATMTTTTTYTDGSWYVIQRTRNEDNTITITTWNSTDPTPQSTTTPNLLGSTNLNGEEAGSAGVGRISWRQLEN